MTPPDKKPTLWARMHVPSGAAFLILVSLLFTAAVFKITNSNNEKFSRFQSSVCTLVDQSNHNVGANKARVLHAYNEAIARTNAEQDISNALRFYHLPKLARDEATLARQDRSSARTLHIELMGIKTINIEGC